MSVMLMSLVGFGGWAAAVAVWDIRHRRVPNWLVCVGLIGAIAQWPLAARMVPVTPTQSLVGGALAMVVFVPLYAFRAMGAADVKVFAVLGLWSGASALLPVWIIASAAAGVHALYAVTRLRLGHGVVPLASVAASSGSETLQVTQPMQAMQPMQATQPTQALRSAQTVRAGHTVHAMRGAPYAAFLVLAALGVVLHRLYPSIGAGAWS